MLFDLNKFQYVHHTNEQGINETIALAKYKGKTYRGVAKCHPDYNYEPAIGEMIAARRCDLAIRKARLRDRRELMEIYKKVVEYATRDASYAYNKFDNAYLELNEAQETYDDFMKWLASQND